jgi:predicted DNA-binding transcriptional regulator YafY
VRENFVELIKEIINKRNKRNFSPVFLTICQPLIHLEEAGDAINYLLTKPLHAPQRQDPSDPTLFTLRCYPTDDLMYAILSHGRKLEVLEPEEFRRRIREEVEGMKEGYEE